MKKVNKPASRKVRMEMNVIKKFNFHVREQNELTLNYEILNEVIKIY